MVSPCPLCFLRTGGVVVTDYDMPDINGLVFTANCPACRVVIISVDAAEGAEQAPIGLTFALLQKPVPSEVLIAAVCSDAIRNASGMSGARRTAEQSNEIL